MLPANLPLPVVAAIPELRQALAAGTAAVLQAPPGAGKTTVVPVALLEEPWLAGRRLVMLEPRRLAARAAAARLARNLGEPLGETVGYHIRFERVAGRRTRILVVTEGILTRMLQRDPSLDGIGLLIFDEFHERSLHADLGLALALDAQRGLRNDLRVLVMSATLDGARVARMLDDAPVVRAEGRLFPVETRHLERESRDPAERQVARAVCAALEASPGDVLAFLPGRGEIHRTAGLLAAAGLPATADVRPLYSNLPPADQDAAIEPAPPGRRKVVLATSIAETSLTIEGVTAVVDSGLMRIPQFDAGTAMTRLATVRVSKASADQRRGRAGRLAPGLCLRLWTAGMEAGLVAHTPPEILAADLAPLMLELAGWGVHDPAELRWLDPPPAPAVGQARALLRTLDAVDAAGRLSGKGRRMLDTSLHPRLAHLLIEGQARGLGDLAIELAAILGEQDLFAFEPGAPIETDLRLRLDALHADPEGTRPTHQSFRINRAARSLVLNAIRNLRRSPGGGGHSRGGGAPATVPPRPASDADACGGLVAAAYPDRLAQRRADAPGLFRLASGRGACMDAASSQAGAEFLAVAHVEGGGRDARIRLAAPISADEIRAQFASALAVEETVAWDAQAQEVACRRRTSLGALVLGDQPLPRPPPERVVPCLLEGIRQLGLRVLPWTRDAEDWRARVAFLRRLEGPDRGWPDLGDSALAETLEAWLAPHLPPNFRRLRDLERLDLLALLRGILPWERQKRLDELAPTHLQVPSGSRIRLDYTTADTPILAVRLQEVFGLTETPCVGGGRVPVLMHLLSPAMRPVQITRDLASFWREAYFQVRKDLRGRYPRHPWPDDPLAATPTRRSKRAT